MFIYVFGIFQYIDAQCFQYMNSNYKEKIFFMIGISTAGKIIFMVKWSPILLMIG